MLISQGRQERLSAASATGVLLSTIPYAVKPRKMGCSAVTLVLLSKENATAPVAAQVVKVARMIRVAQGPTSVALLKDMGNAPRLRILATFIEETSGL